MKQCKICHKNLSKRQKFFCSNKCRGIDLTKTFIKEKNPNFRGGKTKCIDCNKELSVRYTKEKRCKECWLKFLKKSPENHPHWKGGTHCVDCQKSIYYGQKRCQICWFKHNRGRNNSKWKEKLTYKYLHKVIRQQFGNPFKCEFCGNTGRLHWANKTGQYLRERHDWLSLCVKCHRNYDLKRTKY